jgi:soluble lytic murein transglycosylase-like protein
VLTAQAPVNQAAAANPTPAAAANTKPPPSAAELQLAAMTLQRAASRKQAEDLGLWLMPLDGKPAGAGTAEADCEPLDDNLVNPLIDDAAKQQSLDPKLLRALIGQESAFRPCAMSAKGAKGLMQLMPETAAELGVSNPFDPKQNLDGGSRYLKQLIEKYKGDLPQALGAYNAGPKTVDGAGGVPNLQETQEYVDAILTRAGLKPADAPSKPEETQAKPVVPAPQPENPQAKPGDLPAKAAEQPARPTGQGLTPAVPSAKPADIPAKPSGTP